MSCFICAEAGVNWRDLVDADDMIREAAAAGADAVKFQCYEPFPTCHPLHTELNRIRLDDQKIRYLYWRCQQHGIEFMCTPMYPEAVAMLDPYVKRWKIRFADQTNKALIKSCLATNKDVLISMQDPYQYLADMGCDLLYCDPTYPPSESPTLTLKGFDGYSCHIPFWDEIRTDLISHIKYLEVHVRLDKYEPHYCPIDTAVSITMTELEELCRRLKK